MPTKFLNTNVLDNGLIYVQNKVSSSSVLLSLISAYSQGDSYTVVRSNALCDIALSSADLVLQDGTTSFSRRLTVAQKSGSASATATNPDLHVAIVDTTNSEVLAVTDETTNQNISSGNNVTIPSFDIQMNQPV